MSETIQHEEWLAALIAAQAKNDNGLTSGEWSERLGFTNRRALEYLQRAAARGWVSVGRRTVYRIDGVPTTVPVYTVRQPSEGGLAKKGAK